MRINEEYKNRKILIYFIFNGFLCYNYMRMFKVFLIFFTLGIVSAQFIFPKAEKKLAVGENYQVKEILLNGALMTMTWTSTNVMNTIYLGY